ncbi:hypothetical protein [Sphingomicrobium sediminis]|uniref:Uncharacterized protein n=1 Tax=Sphingomicrobium sediminis TaxID=2950949 RepID=A0A9X2EFE1_9SPHN|nr:hypothetical protein [Sphingomicrobium sediminis]MCM8556550.1 hypothetical protein [Sphingomicrobium sediminis]
MKNLATLAALALLAAPAAAQDLSPADAIGTWTGDLALPNGMSLPIEFQVSDEDADGVLEAQAYSRAQTDQPLPVDGVALEDDVLTITIGAVGAAYEGTWNGEAFVGTFSQGGTELPLTLTQAE